MNSGQYEDMSAIQGNKSAVANLFVQSSGNLYSISYNQGVVKKEKKLKISPPFLFFSLINLLFLGHPLQSFNFRSPTTFSRFSDLNIFGHNRPVNLFKISYRELYVSSISDKCGSAAVRERVDSGHLS